MNDAASDRTAHTQPTIALALGAGGARGLARSPGPRQRRSECQARAASGEGGMVGHTDAQAEQRRERSQQAFGLPPGPTKGQAQQVPSLDCHVRVVAGSAPLASPGRMPGRERLRVTQTVRLPRCWSALSYSGQFATR